MKSAITHLAWRLLGAFIGLLAGGALGFFLGNVIAETLGINSFEDAHGYFVAFLIVPPFALGGAILGAIMIYLSRWWNLRIGAGLVIILGIFLFTQREQFIPDPPAVMEKLGNFDLLTYSDKTMGDSYKLRYRGKPFAIHKEARTFSESQATYKSVNAIITFNRPLSETAFVVNVGDPNNTSYFFLVHEANAKPKVDYLSEASGGSAAVDWLDVAPTDATAPRDRTSRRERLAGNGRWLLLGDNCVLDVHTWETYSFITYSLQDGTDASINPVRRPLGMSPDQRSLVRLGSSDIREWGTDKLRGHTAQLIVYNFVNNDSYAVPIDRAQMRYAATELIDQSWVDYYFTWESVAGRPYRLKPRADFTPLPYQGWLTDEGGQQQYKLTPVKAELLDNLIAFLEQKFQAVRGETKRDDNSTYVDLQINGRGVTVGYANDGYSEPSITLWQEAQADQPNQVVPEIAQGFDAVLRTGVYDMLFLGDPVAVTEPAIAGVQTFTDLSQEHTEEPVQYEQIPPVGGKHNPRWLNCGVYIAPVKNEQAVHSMEHGAVWITYQPTLPAEQVASCKA